MGMGWDKLLTWIGMELADLGLTELDPELGTAQPLLVSDIYRTLLSGGGSAQFFDWNLL